MHTAVIEEDENDIYAADEFELSDSNQLGDLNLIT